MAHIPSPTEGQDDEILCTINVIPFVDIVLVLLIIFMVTSAVIIRASFQVELPRAVSGAAEVESTLNIVLTKEQAIFLDGHPVSRAELTRAVQDQAAKNPKLQAVIAADKAARYGEVVEIIDLLKQNGVAAFALNIEREIQAAK